jgi:transposase
MTQNIKKSLKAPAASNFQLAPMNPCVAGIDIGARSVFICVGFADGHQEIREYLTFTKDLRNMLTWIQQSGIHSVAMESTGVYWIPVYDILAQAGIDVTLANAYYLKTVPGRKTDVKDCQWIQQLHAYGLLRGSFRPDDQGVKLRGYVRQRSRLFELASQQVQLMHKALVQMNLQLNHVVSDITGATGIQIIRAIVSGERIPAVLAKHRNVRCKKDEKEIAKALDGNYRDEQLLALKHALEAYDFFHQQVLECEEAIEQMLNAWQFTEENGSIQESELTKHASKNGQGIQRKSAHNRSPYHFEAETALKKILGVNLAETPGMDINGIMKIIGETGIDMSKWPSAKHFASWLGLCPGNKISGGKILSGKTKPSANKAAQALRLAANTLYRSKTALGAYFRRMRARLGAPKAITAAAHKLAKILYTMLKERKNFTEIGQAAYEQAYKERQLCVIKKRAQEFGYNLVAI